MTFYNSNTIPSAAWKFGFRASCWRTGLLLAFFSALLLSGCGGKTDSRLAEEMKGLESSSAEKRTDALLHLADMGGLAKKAAPRAIELLKDGDAGVRNAAIQLIIRTKHNTKESLAGISALATGDKDEEVQGNALNALLGFEAHEEHAKACVKLLGGEDRMREIGSLGLAGAKSPAVVAQKELVAGLKDKLPYVRMNCAKALGNLGSAASADTKAQLKAAEADKEKQVADAVTEALGKLK
jgi:HEAT repeat protein|tara:strand:- start:260 stop:979 length:720 start_codon:yes stop_codon:yes gene_type:complete